MEVRLETLTPVHIGSGRKLINGLDFSVEGNKCYIFDPEKIFDLIGEDRIEQWVTSIKQSKTLFDFLKINSINFRLEDISSAILPMIYSNVTATELNECIKTCNIGAYIPGSSIKGAIRTLLMKRKFEADSQISESDFHRYDYKRKRHLFEDGNLEIKFFGKNATDKPWRMLQVGDCHFSDLTTKISEVKILNLNGSHRYSTYKFKPQNLMVEVIPANQTSNFNLKVNETLSLLNQGKAKNFKKFNENYQHHNDLNNIQSLFKAINEESNKILEKELNDWEIEKQDYSGNFDLLQTYRRIENNIKNLDPERECILRVGGHSGWRFTTGAWVLELDNKQLTDDIWFKLRRTIRKKNYEEKIMTPKTRKTTPDGNLLGFVKLSLD